MVSTVIQMIGYPTTLTNSGYCSHHFSLSSTRNNDSENLQPVIAALCMRQKSICECCGRIGHKADTYIIRGPKFLPPILRRKMNQLNALHGDKPKKNHQYNGTANLWQLTSNPVPLLPEPTLWFQLSWGNLITIPQIMAILLQTLQSNIAMTMFHIQTPFHHHQQIDSTGTSEVISPLSMA